MSAKENQRKIISQFIQKLQDIMKSYPELIFWNQTGTEMIINPYIQFEKEVLSNYFRHNNFTSFSRQLNMYGFEKKSKKGQQFIFFHPIFQKGNEENFSLIKRKSKLKAEKCMEKQFQKKNQKLLKNINENVVIEDRIKETLVFFLEYKEKATKNLKKVKRLVEKLCLELQNSRLKKVTDCTKELKGSMVKDLEEKLVEARQIEAFIEENFPQSLQKGVELGQETGKQESSRKSYYENQYISVNFEEENSFDLLNQNDEIQNKEDNFN